MTRIVGCLLVRDDDLFVEQAVRNVFGFCDELVFVDHRSRDRTPEILARLAASSPIPATVHRVHDAGRSQDFVKDYAGEDVWVLGLDGDELYDPRGLAEFRSRLLGGEAADRWLVRGNVVHCTELNRRARTATGYVSPPAPSVTKLFNFRRITAWHGDNPERLNDPSGLRFKPGALADKYELNHVVAWDDSPFRCLHLCFVRRSSRQRGGGARMNVPDRNAPRRAPVRLWRRAREAAGLPPPGTFKDLYRVGEQVTVSTVGFFSD